MEKESKHFLGTYLEKKLLEIALLDYKNKKYKSAAGMLLSVLDFYPLNSEAKTYLKEIILTKNKYLAPQTIAKISKIIKGSNHEAELNKRRDKAKTFANNFIKEHYPNLLSLFNQSWETLKNIPEGTNLELSNKQAAFLGLAEQEKKTDYILLFQILFTLIRIFDEITESTDIKKIKLKVHNFSKQNKLKKKISAQIIKAYFLKFYNR